MAWSDLINPFSD